MVVHSVVGAALKYIFDGGSQCGRSSSQVYSMVVHSVVGAALKLNYLFFNKINQFIKSKKS